MAVPEAGGLKLAGLRIDSEGHPVARALVAPDCDQWPFSRRPEGGGALALGKWIRPLALYFAAQLAMGIVLVHAREGWFVVGAGRNGMEYSVLLIVVLLAVAWAARPPAQVEG